MANLLGKNIWAKRKELPTWYQIGSAVPRLTRSAQRHKEEQQWRTKDQEMPYYWRPTADIEEDNEEDPAHSPAAWAWEIAQEAANRRNQMSRYRLISKEVEAHQWFQNGDHPNDGPADSEGQVVRYFRYPGIPGTEKCNVCGHRMHDHGCLDQPGEELVCPGDWIVTGDYGTYSVHTNTDFQAMYEPLE